MAEFKTEFIIEPEVRPCWVKGKRALFHRWADSARPVAPKGQPEVETDLRYQLWHVHGIVEYEDGTIDRVWPYYIQFAENPAFKEYAWEQMEEERDRAVMLEVERELDEQLEALGIPRIEVTEDPAATAETAGIVLEPVEREKGGIFDKALRKLFSL